MHSRGSTCPEVLTHCGRPGPQVTGRQAQGARGGVSLALVAQASVRLSLGSRVSLGLEFSLQIRAESGIWAWSGIRDQPTLN